MRLRRWACVVWAGVAVGATAVAAPEDDYKRGLASYNRGDVVTAMSLLREPAKAGHAPSQVLLGFILDRAGFVDDAVKLYGDAARQNDPEGLVGMANYYITGRGVAKDEKVGMQHFSKAADLGHVLAIEVVASAHIRNDPVLASAPPEQAAAAVRRAADNGHMASVEALELAYTTGRWGLPVDAQQAAAWKAKAAALKAQRAVAAKPANKASQ